MTCPERSPQTSSLVDRSWGWLAPRSSLQTWWIPTWSHLNSNRRNNRLINWYRLMTKRKPWSRHLRTRHQVRAHFKKQHRSTLTYHSTEQRMTNLHDLGNLPSWKGWETLRISWHQRETVLSDLELIISKTLECHISSLLHQGISWEGALIFSKMISENKIQSTLQMKSMEIQLLSSFVNKK